MLYPVTGAGSEPLPPQYSAPPPDGGFTQAAPPSYEEVVKGLAPAQTVGVYEPTARTTALLQPSSASLAQPRSAWDESRAIGRQAVVVLEPSRPGAVQRPVIVRRPFEWSSGQQSQQSVKDTAQFVIVIFIGSLVCLSPICALLCGVPAVILAVKVSGSATHYVAHTLHVMTLYSITHVMRQPIYICMALDAKLF